LPCGCIKLSYGGCIYDENLIIITVFANFGGALAPTTHSVASLLLGVNEEGATVLVFSVSLIQHFNI
jgi:hypothetical protein